MNSLGREERTRPSGKEKGPCRVQLAGATGAKLSGLSEAGGEARGR